MAKFSSSSRLSRRHFLSNTALATGALAGSSALLAACGSSSNSSGGTVTLTIMGNAGEITPAYLKEFTKLNPTIKTKFLTFDQSRLNAMFVAGSPPDIIRGIGFDSAFNSARGMALNLDPYLAKSTVLKTSDLEAIQDLWRWDGKQTGKGSYYGLAKDWSQDATLWANNALFKQAGLDPVSTTEPLTYDELLTLGKKLTVRQGGKIQAYGISAGWGGAATLYQMVAQQGGSVFSTDLTKADFTTPEAQKAMQWYVDYANAHIGPTPFDPDPNGWDGPTYQAGRIGLAQDGYWFNGEVGVAGGGTATLQANSVLLPAPQMGSKRISSCFAGTGIWIAAKSKNPDQAWKFMEYFMTGTPAHDRATGGWGIPVLKSMVPDMPHTEAQQSQSYQAVQNELPYFAPLTVSPYTTSTAVGTLLDKYLQQVVKGQVTLSEAGKQITSDVNLLLAQGVQSIG
jgi:multiple sugar transport system substrate-binding protein